MDTIEIRPGAPADAEAVAVLHIQSWRTAYAGIMPQSFLDSLHPDIRRDVWRERLVTADPATALFVAESGGELLGFTYLARQSDGRVLLDNLHVRPDLKRGGIGGRLLRRALHWTATEFPGHPMYLEVLKDNHPAIAFYERHGGVRAVERIGHWPQGFDLAEFEYVWPATPPNSEYPE
ncbi:GNAT family N-acetyltransferase [Nocardia yamanashiensis]|uniref:GNAT family N-acetyltransferase n=1 Tax=Nocardia yamanashiensis TaxID=209247 RepID=UPI001E3F4BD6|nr:GNAT family N-acetyltransferase [Nocardia yamanashiensis]UGT43552.1 GNAT family N-acetyltransferase [Nocardia yamanashiensis]